MLHEASERRRVSASPRGWNSVNRKAPLGEGQTCPANVSYTATPSSESASASDIPRSFSDMRSGTYLLHTSSSLLWHVQRPAVTHSGDSRPSPAPHAKGQYGTTHIRGGGGSIRRVPGFYGAHGARK